MLEEWRKIRFRQEEIPTNEGKLLESATSGAKLRRMIPFDEIDSRLDAIGKDRAWLAAVTGRSYDSIRGALAPNAEKKRRSALLQKALSDAIAAEEKRRGVGLVPSGYAAIFLNDEEFDRADRASRIAGCDSLAQFCRDAIQSRARQLIRAAAAGRLRELEASVDEEVDRALAELPEAVGTDGEG